MRVRSGSDDVKPLARSLLKNHSTPLTDVKTIQSKVFSSAMALSSGAQSSGSTSSIVGIERTRAPRRSSLSERLAACWRERVTRTVLPESGRGSELTPALRLRLPPARRGSDPLRVKGSASRPPPPPAMRRPRGLRSRPWRTGRRPPTGSSPGSSLAARRNERGPLPGSGKSPEALRETRVPRRPPPWR